MRTVIPLLTFFIFLFLLGCQKSDQDSEAQILNEVDSLTIRYNPYVDSFLFSSPKDYRIEISPSNTNWLNARINAIGGQEKYLVIEITENTSANPRQADVIILPLNNSGPSKKIKIIQDAFSGPFLSTNKREIILGGTALSQDSFSINANVQWEIKSTPSSVDWIEITTWARQNNSTIVIKTKKDNLSAPHTATLTLSSPGNPDLQPVNISVSQRILTAGIGWSFGFGDSNLDQFHSVVSTSDGGFLATGAIRILNKTGANLWLVKTDAGGNKLWEKKYGGTRGDVANCITSTNDGGYITAGFASSTDGDLSGQNPVNGDAWIVKFDASGNKIWQKVLGGSEFDWASGIAKTTDGSYVFCGSSNSNDGALTTNKGGKDVWVVKLDAAGNMLWQKSFGGSADDEATGVIVDADGSLIIAANTKSNNGDVSGYRGGISDGWILKLDGSGNKIWAKNIGSTFADEANAITLTPTGQYAIAGNTLGYVDGSRYNGDFLFVQLDKNGNIVLEKAMGSFELDKAYAISALADGGFVLAGYVSSVGGDVSGPQSGVTDAWIVKIDANANKVWNKTFGGNSNTRGLALVNAGDNDIVMAGYKGDNVSTGTVSYLVQKGLLLKIDVE